MKVFRYDYDGHQTTICAPSSFISDEYFKSEVASGWDEKIEIDESLWDDKSISYYENDDISTVPIKASIRDVMEEGETMIISTNDPDLLS